MSSVPYIFASDTGNIPLSQLDANFSNVKLSVDYVIQNTQSNITAVGTLTSLSVSGNVLGNGILSVSGNTTISSNLSVSGIITATGNVTGGNIATAGLITATGNVSGGNLNVTGNIVDSGALNIITGNNGNIALTPNGTGIVTVASAVSATGNVTGGNIATAGIVTATGNITGNNIISTTSFRLPVYANTTVRDSTIASPVAGMMIFVTGTGMQVRGATQWNTITGSGT